jgi:chemotaxis protein methyltransferase CheR
MMTKETLKIFADLIFRETGIVFKESNYYQLETRIEHILDQNSLTLDAFVRGVVNERRTELLAQLHDQATNNETSFFRDPRVFQSLFAHVIKPFFDKSPGCTLQIWSVACSTGQEPYSLAMELENHRLTHKDVNYRILATDYSQRVLKKAQAGIYSQVEVQRGLSAINLVRYFEKLDARENAVDIRWKVKPQLQTHIDFKPFNLLAPVWRLPQKSFDIILCRNVLIYQDQDNRREILKKLAQHLHEDGILVLGCAEAITNLPEIYTAQQLGEATTYKLTASARNRHQVA